MGLLCISAIFSFNKATDRELLWVMIALKIEAQVK